MCIRVNPYYIVTITYYHNNSAYINIKDGDVQNCTDFDFEITKFNWGTILQIIP